MKEFELKLTEAEMQTVFNALIERPFKDVAGLVAKVQATYQKVQRARRNNDLRKTNPRR